MFLRRKIEKHKAHLLTIADDVLCEDERVYRNQVRIFCDDVRTVSVSGRGLFKARLLGSCFLIYAFAQRWQSQPAEVHGMIQALSGAAVSPLLESTASPSYSLAEARELGEPFVKSQMASISDELANGPTRFGSSGVDEVGVHRYAEAMGLSRQKRNGLWAHLQTAPSQTSMTDGFRRLVDTSHEALADSIGRDHYASVRQRFEPQLQSGTMSRFRLLAELASALR
jgi:hypothetical protein